jgi:hypothetical protein
MGKAFYAKLLTVMVGLAVGSLSGSSVFHLIPQVIARYTHTLERMGFVFASSLRPIELVDLVKASRLKKTHKIKYLRP